MAAPAPCIGYAFDILINLHITGMIESPITAMIHTAAFLYIIFFFPPLSHQVNTTLHTDIP